MELVLQNVIFPLDLGKMLCKLGNIEIEGLDLSGTPDITFKDIAMINNLEQRRIAVSLYGPDRISKEVGAEEVSSVTLEKSTEYVKDDGTSVTINFQDTYSLYRIHNKKLFGKQLGWGISDSPYRDYTYYVKCKDTSTDREYIIWVDIASVARANEISLWANEFVLDAIHCIAWTIQTDVIEGNIKQIIRQGDCVFIEPIDVTIKRKAIMRSITREEYINLLKVES